MHKLQSNINIYEDESNSKNEIICYCSMYCFNQIYHIFIICLVLFFLIICYFLISFSTCSNDNKLCLYCFLMSISLFLIFNVKIIYNMYKSIKSILLFLISVTESLLVITIFSSKNEHCSLESFEVYLLSLIIVPVLTYCNFKFIRNH